MWVSYDDRYDVSDEGLVLDKTKGVIIKQYPDKDGYMICNLHNHPKKVHRLVAICFLSNPDDEVNHIDHNRTNNNVSNLEWCSKRANRLKKLIPPTNIDYYRGNYRVRFVIDKKLVYNKSFKTIEEAETARDAFKTQIKNPGLA